jgi:hypothetical protein
MRNTIPIAVTIIAYLGFMISTLTDFPAYFFCDEAVHGLDAQYLISTGADMHGSVWPVFFRGLGDFPLSLTVYLQIPSVLSLGLNEFSVRLTTVFVSLIGIAAAYGILRYMYCVPYAYIVIPLLMVSPFWFLHARTGFEYIPATSFFLAFLLSYCLAFTKNHRFILSFSVFAAATFYSYTPGRGWIIGTIALLILFNLSLLTRTRFSGHLLRELSLA